MRKSSPKPVFFRHSEHAEWGPGLIVEENPSKLCLFFEVGGRRPFVNDPRVRRLLWKTELPSAEAGALIAKFEKTLPKKVGKKKEKALKPATKDSAAKEPAEAVSDDATKFFDEDFDDDE